MKKVIFSIGLCFTLTQCFASEFEYGYYYDSKSKKVYQMKCSYSPSMNAIFYERQAIKKGGIWIPNPNFQDVGYISGNCDFVYNKLKEVVRQGKMKKVQ